VLLSIARRFSARLPDIEEQASLHAASSDAAAFLGFDEVLDD